MIKEDGVAKVLLRVSHLIFAHLIELRHRQSEVMKMPRHIDEGPVLIAVRTYDTNDTSAVRVCLAGIHSIGALLLDSHQYSVFSIQYSAPKLQCVMDTSYLARPDDILQDTVSLKEDMLAVDHLYLASHDRINERQLGQASIV